MNKTAIKNYAIWARVQLIESAKQRAFEYGITENGENKPNVDTVGGRLLSAAEKEQRTQLIGQIRQKGFSQVMEEAAYTWFNRFIALRFMEVNGYLPSKVRVFTDENGAFKPEILKEAMSIELDELDRNKVLNLLDKQDNEALYKYLLITQCNALNTGLPYMFEKIANWSELLFPANLLRSDSVVARMVSDIPEEDWTDAVQIIGWMYQYYNLEVFNEIYDGDNSKRKIDKDRIPAATQLFTPDWVVRYMVENSLGRLWMEGHPEDDLKTNWKYYLEDTGQKPDVLAKLSEIRKEYAALRPEDIKVIDPCMGSGHILVYAFDVLMQIYTSAGWSERDAARSILENNLYGLDIDDRAGQLAYFAVMMKARKYSRRILNGEVNPNVFAIQDSSFMTDEFIAYVAGKDYAMKADLILLRSTFNNAKECGSILTMKGLNYEALFERIDIISRSYAEDLFQAQYQVVAKSDLLGLVRQAQAMSQKYNIVVTNPPYLSSSRFAGNLSSYVNKYYADEKADMATVMLNRMIFGFATSNAYIAAITTVSWMFIHSFQAFRKKLLENVDFINLVDFGTELFEGKIGHLPIAAWINRKSNIKHVATAIRLVDFCYSKKDEKEKEFFNKKNSYRMKQENFNVIPGSPIAYWVSDTLVEDFANGTPFEKIGFPKVGMQTSNNDKYLRLWYEVDSTEFFSQSKKWIKYVKGGPYRKWYGNLDYVVWYNGTPDFIMQQPNARVLPESELDKLKCTWSDIATTKFACRTAPIDSFHDISGHCFYPSADDYFYLLAFSNTCVFQQIINLLNSSIHYQTGDVARVPVLIDKKRMASSLAEENVELAKRDWDSFETSWDFGRHPLVAAIPEGGSFFEVGNIDLAECYMLWEAKCNERFSQLKANEEELNRIFIDIYGLQDELTPEVDDKDVTVRKADLGRDIRSLISYAVGCMFGRYNLGYDGLAYAGGEWDASKHTLFPADKDNIIPICDDDYFDDDITGRFIKWIETVYGSSSLESNLKFISDALGGKGTPRDVIRSYFLKDFYADHLKIYQKRPIYWLFDSGKKNGFKALIYMHRYQSDILARMRTDYVHEQQERYRTQLQMFEDSAQSALPSERVKLNKQITKLKDQALEIQKYEEKIHHLADQMISINLDDGVKVNYAKFEEVLAKLK